MNKIYSILSAEQINRADEFFRIGSSYNSDMLRRLLDEWGVIAPLIVSRHGESYRIVEGFDRFDCAVLHGITELPVIEVDTDEFSCYRFAIFNAVMQNSCDIFDIAQVLAVLSDYFLVPRQDIATEYLPFFGFSCRDKILDKLITIHKFDPSQKKLCRDECIETDKILLISDIDRTIRNDMIELMIELRPSINKVKQIIELIDEISGREGKPPAEVLSDPLLRSILDDEACNAGQKLNRFREALYVRRNPALSCTLELVDRKIRQLKLDNRIKLIVPPYLEGDQLRLEAEFENKEQLEEIARNLLQTAGLKSFGELLDIIKEP
ncbi:MAG: hypothetical protein RBU23_03790 [Candidatus Auribacterota bacterium]|nr:hypothetical protein [Candidatus Auribacterota bacterium]